MNLDAWYQRELAYFRQTADDFAARFPRIAARLALSDSPTPDPHVERLIQAVALLNARTRRKLDDGFPEIAAAMLGILYPHLRAPVPSVSIVRFSLEEGQSTPTAGTRVPSGSRVEADDPGGRAAAYRTCGDVWLYPLRVATMELRPQPLPGPPSPRQADAEAALRITLTPTEPTVPLADYRLRGDRLRFQIRLSELGRSGRLLELLTTAALEIAVAGPEGDAGEPAAVLPGSCIRHVGFNDEEALFPRQPQTPPGVHLLAEYFALPEKFLAFEVSGLTPSVLSRAGRELNLSVLLSETDEQLEGEVSPRTVAAGCVPVVNLFQMTTQAINLHERETAYRVIPDPRAKPPHEVYTVDSVSLQDDVGEPVECCRFYSADHSALRQMTGEPVFWHADRRDVPGGSELGDEPGDEPTEMWLTLIPPSATNRSPDTGLEVGAFEPVLPGGRAVCRVTCFNRGAPSRLSRMSPGTVRFRAVGLGVPAAVAECLRTPTPTVRRHLHRRTIWPLVSQLSLNHLSLGGGDSSAAVLRELLAVNDLADSAATRSLIEGVRDLHAEPAVRRMGRAFARGTGLTMTLEEDRFAGDSPFLFAAVISRFLAMHAAVNSFTQLSATTDRRTSEGRPAWHWPPATGTGAVL